MTNQEIMLVIGLSIGGLIGAKFFFDNQKRRAEEEPATALPPVIGTTLVPAPAPAPTPAPTTPAPIMGAPLVGSFSVQAL